MPKITKLSSLKRINKNEYMMYDIIGIDHITRVQLIYSFHCYSEKTVVAICCTDINVLDQCRFCNFSSTFGGKLAF